MTDSFWKLPEVSAYRAPVTILKEQAVALTDATHGNLKGEVSSGSGGEDQIHAGLHIIVPALNNYKYHILTYTYPITLYPGRLYDAISKEFSSIQSEQEFERQLKVLLGSKQIENVLRGLLSHVAALKTGG